MVQAPKTGLFGKMPAHGDFVVRDLPSGFVNVWDEWLQHYIAGSREQLGEEWLNIYLTSPIWRFTFSTGVIDGNNWAGIMLPSVDRVGRYYPLSAVLRLPEDINPLEFMTLQTNWFAALEELALQALNGEMTIDELSAGINDIELQINSNYTRNVQPDNGSTALQIDMEFEEQLPVSVYSELFNVLLQNTFASYGVWTTTGSEMVQPCLFLTRSMPPISGMPAMMDGQWQHWGWKQPYIMKEFKTVAMHE